MMIPECDKCYSQVFPLVMTGVGYSIYAAAAWGSIPFIVSPNTVGTAFGITTAIQNIGLVLAPTIVGEIKDHTRMVDHGFFWVNFFFMCVNVLGFILNASLYYQDIYYHKGVLDKVPGAEKQETKDSLESEETESLMAKTE
jgi:MFS family permease